MPALIRNGFLALILCAILVYVAYMDIDKPVVFWVNNAHISNYHFFVWFTRIPEFFVALSLVIYPVVVLRFSFGKLQFTDRAMIAMANSVAIAIFIHMPMKIIFGRYWPKTWIHNNLSLLQNNAYGFHWMHYGTAFASFPSGHTTVTLAAATVIWMLYPRWRWFAVIISLLAPIGLIALNDHFVGDVIGGGFLGAMTAVYVVKLSGLAPRIDNIPRPK